MLILSRKMGESICLPGTNTTITIHRTSGGRVSLAIDAPRELANTTERFSTTSSVIETAIARLACGTDLLSPSTKTGKQIGCRDPSDKSDAESSNILDEAAPPRSAMGQSDLDNLATGHGSVTATRPYATMKYSARGNERRSVAGIGWGVAGIVAAIAKAAVANATVTHSIAKPGSVVAGSVPVATVSMPVTTVSVSAMAVTAVASVAMSTSHMTATCMTSAPMTATSHCG
ncbi:carbon storage regulator [Stieleria sedimenti]|uniref:carbon storage regulator n=1 Tax=Stieleria sedimenti TaxID=2976331 RepID=UPI00217F2D72|nr:carbon storage regulator [Stieleria sedimenti]